MEVQTYNNTTSPHTYNARSSTLPPYLPPSMLDKRLKWSAFLSFRGEDTRECFTTHLRDQLKTKGLNPFMDDEGMDRGDVVQPCLDEAIINSALVVAIISPRYADSRWCLNELALILECRKRVIPVFYGVDPYDVRMLRGEFGDGFKKLTNDELRVTRNDIEKWERALEKIGNISGHTCHDESYKAEVIRRIVQQVWNELRNTPEYAVKPEVGLSSRVDEVVKALDIHSRGVQFMCIYGPPGVGKTTLANAVFDKLRVNFEKSCFISSVCEKLATESGLLSVQNQLIKALSLGKEPIVKQVGDGISALQRLVQQKSVLVVLDDLLKVEQLENIGIFGENFGDGSRIIVTACSRNEDLLHQFKHSGKLYAVKTLEEAEARELFCLYALGRRKSTQELEDLTNGIVSLMGGLPLALEVLGSFLVKRRRKEWEDVLAKLKDNQQSKLQQVIKLSYDDLDDQEKTVFLDIACLLVQVKLKKEDVIDILESCDLRAELAISNLVMRSLLKITDDEQLWMHDQIRDMGRFIVENECLHDAGIRSRLWDSKEIKYALSQEKVTQAVRGIVLDIEKPPEITYGSTAVMYLRRIFDGFISQQRPEEEEDSILNLKWFMKTVHLKLLKIDNAKLQGDFRHMPCELRWLRWRGCPQKSLPNNVPEEIRVLDLSGSNIECLWSSSCSYWGFNKVVAGNLVVINLSYCLKLTALPNMSGYPHLKKLILEHCVELTSLHKSIGNLSSLVHLNLRGCTNLVEFPSDVTGMKSLQVLILSECSKFRKLPDDVRSMKSLIELHLDRTPITKLPKYVHYLTKLQVLNLDNCCEIAMLPACIGYLTSLRELSISYTKLKELPDSIGSLTNLEILRLIQCSLLNALPESLGKLESLTELHLNGSSIKPFSASICSRHYLKVFV